MQLECNICHHSFSTKAALSSHIYYKHKHNDKNTNCTKCGASFSKNGNLKRHQIICKAGNKQYDHTLQSSISRQDTVTIEQKYENFSSYNKFVQWKEALENKQQSQFTKVRGTKRDNSGNQTMYFRCHRNGIFHSKSTGARHIKLQGTNKTGYCPAKMNVNISPGGRVNVRFIDVHSGHTFDLGRMCISKADRAAIAEKIALKIPFQQILDDMGDSVINNKLHRIHLTTRKDLWNIAASYKLNSEPVLHKNDFLCVGRLGKTHAGNIKSYKEECVIEISINSTFENRKLEVLKSLERITNSVHTIQNEEQLQAVSKQLTPIETMIDAYKLKDITTVSIAS
ncbi:hypothetical protein NQ317_011105 [Molorchus minor]|uniref:C2H2-type domain-containing protein n=1 Tax=Molorchus minor TaxID=1323400 RepID=A0ABQ9K0Q5_9CUCU|nr:hypothetical protein NQ317_011105 [Molorchus minor]